ncbi:Peptidase G1, partial [Tylopilus felleus]
RRELGQNVFLDRIEQSDDDTPDGIVYTNNWAGAVWDEGDGTFDFITGTFAAPVPKGPDGSGGSAWVGVDGDTCDQSFFRAGINFIVNKNETSYEAWYQWYADEPRPFPSEIRISAGDRIRVTIFGNSSTTGNATVENLTNGQSMTQPVQSILALCGQNAEWVVTLFGENSNPASFANFTTVTFTDAKATGPHGPYTPYGATILDIKQNNRPLTDVSITESSFTVTSV